MVRRVIVVLLVLPMLMPPGMCICQFQAPFMAAFAAAASPSKDAEEPAACCRKCGRAKCRHQQQAPTQQTGGQPSDDSRPESPEHAPGCPAHPCYVIRMAPTVETKTLPGDVSLSHDVVDSRAPLPAIASSRDQAIDASPPACPEDIFLFVRNIRC